MIKLTPYEKKAKSEIEAWKNEREGVISKVFNFFLRPLEWAADYVIPESMKQVLQKAALGAMEMMHDAAYWTYPAQGILDEANTAGITVNDYRELSKHDLKNLDKIAQSFFTSNKVIAALEGGGLGLGGLALIAADVPTLFTVSFRAIQQIGSSYGFDVEDPGALPTALSIFGVASGAGVLAKASVLIDMRVAAMAFGKNWAYEIVAQTTATGIIARVLKENTKRLPREIAQYITKRKLAQFIPVVSAGVSAGFNYWFLSSVVRSAYMVFRDMYLARKYGTEYDKQAVSEVLGKAEEVTEVKPPTPRKAVRRMAVRPAKVRARIPAKRPTRALRGSTPAQRSRRLRKTGK